MRFGEGIIHRVKSLIGKAGEAAPEEMGRRHGEDTTSETGLTLEGAAVGDYYYKKVQMERTRLAGYIDYELMDDEFPELSSALDIYADNTIAGEEESKERFAVDSEDEKVKEVLEDINKRTGINEEIWPLARDLCKYGDVFEEIVVSNDNLIARLKSLPPSQMFRNEDKFGRLEEGRAFEQKDKTGKVLAQFEAWQVVHFRNRVTRTAQYGRSILAPARRLFKQVQMMEDGMVIGRLSRAHMRYVYKIDVGELPPSEAELHVEKVKRRIKKRKRMNPITGKFDTRANPLRAEEDLFVGVRSGSPAGVERIEGAANLSQIEDVRYFQNKMFTVIKVPKSWLGLEKDVSAKAVITNQDVQFARTVRRLQNVGLRKGLSKIYNIGLLLQGYDLRKVKYDILFPAIKTIDEVRKWQVQKVRAEVAKLYAVDMKVVTEEFILRHFLGLTDQEIKQLVADKEKESEKAKKAAEAERRAKIKAGTIPPEEVFVPLMKLLNELKEIIAMELEGKKFQAIAGG